MKKMANTVNSGFVRVYELSCCSCEQLGETAFLSRSLVPVLLCDGGELSLITGGLSARHCPLAVGQHGVCESQTQQHQN